MRSSELAWKHPRGALWVALKCGHTGSVYFQLRKQERWGGVSSRLKGQMSFRPAFSVPPRSPWALPLSPVILFFSPLFSLEGWEGRTLLNSEQMSWEEVVGWGWAHLRPWDGWRKYCRPDPEWLPYIYGCTLLFFKKKKNPPNNGLRYIQLLSPFVEGRNEAQRKWGAFSRSIVTQQNWNLNQTGLRSWLLYPTVSNPSNNLSYSFLHMGYFLFLQNSSECFIL